MLRRALSAIMCAIVLFVFFIPLAACGPAAASIARAGEIPDMIKPYFGSGVVKIDLSSYVIANGNTVNYRVESSDATVADVTVEGDTLNVNFKAADKAVTVTVGFICDGVECFTDSFELEAKGTTSIACIGDSLTYGHSWHDEAYPMYLSSALTGNVTVENYGVNGASVTGYNPPLNKKYMLETEYTAGLESLSDIVVIMLGTNDSKGWSDAKTCFKEEYISLINSYKTAIPDASIILVTAPPTLDDNKFGIPNSVIKSSVVPIQRAVAEELGLPLVDLRAVMEDLDGGYASLIRGDAAFDGVHLSVEGAQLLASLIASEIDTIVIKKN